MSMNAFNFIAICSYSFEKKVIKENKYKEGMTFKGADKLIKRLAFE